jgi:hypothetical protein
MTGDGSDYLDRGEHKGSRQTGESGMEGVAA